MLRKKRDKIHVITNHSSGLPEARRRALSHVNEMNKILTFFVKISAFFLFGLGTFFLIKDQFFSVDKFGPLPWIYFIIILCIAAISAGALYLCPNAQNYKIAYKIIIGLIVLPYLVVFGIELYGCFRSLFQDRYREGFLYISSLSIGVISSSIGLIYLITKTKNTA